MQAGIPQIRHKNSACEKVIRPCKEERVRRSVHNPGKGLQADLLRQQEKRYIL